MRVLFPFQYIALNPNSAIRSFPLQEEKRTWARRLGPRGEGVGKGGERDRLLRGEGGERGDGGRRYVLGQV